MAIVVGLEATVSQVSKPNREFTGDTHSCQYLENGISGKFRKASFYTAKHSGVTAPVTRSFGKQTFRENASRIFPDTTPVYVTCKFTNFTHCPNLLLFQEKVKTASEAILYSYM